MNSNRSPFQVKSAGHDDGLRSSSSTTIGREGVGPLRVGAWDGSVAVSACSGHGFQFAPETGRRAAALAAEALGVQVA